MEGRPVLLYDGDCGFCKRWALWAHRKGADVKFQPCQEAKTLRVALGIPESRCKETALYIDGEHILTHEQAIHAVLKRMPGARNVVWRTVGRVGRWPAPLLFWPFDAIAYRWVARNRHRFRGPKDLGEADE